MYNILFVVEALLESIRVTGVLWTGVVGVDLEMSMNWAHRVPFTIQAGESNRIQLVWQHVVGG